MSEAVSAQTATDFTRFLAVGGEAALNANESPFLTLEWLQPWRRHFGSGRERVFAVGGADGSKGVFFAEIREETYSGIPLRVVRSFVNNHSVRAALCIGSEPSDLAQGIASDLVARRSEWDVLRLQGVSRQTEFASALCNALGRLGCSAQIEREWSHDALRFSPAGWLAYYQGLSKETRRVNERMRRRLNELGTLSWKKCRTLDELCTGFAAFLEIEGRSWKAESGEVIAGDPAIHGFYADVIEAFGRKEQCEIDVLYLDQRAICAVLSLSYKGRLTTLKSSFDASFAKYSPGWQLFRFLLEDALARSITHVDFYADLEFSKRWATMQQPFCDIIAFSSNWRGRVARATKTGLVLWRKARSG